MKETTLRKTARASSCKNRGKAQSTLDFCFESGQSYRPFTDPKRIETNDAKRESGFDPRIHVKGVPPGLLNIMRPDEMPPTAESPESAVVGPCPSVPEQTTSHQFSLHFESPVPDTSFTHDQSDYSCDGIDLLSIMDQSSSFSGTHLDFLDAISPTLDLASSPMDASYNAGSSTYVGKDSLVPSSFQTSCDFFTQLEVSHEGFTVDPSRSTGLELNLQESPSLVDFDSPFYLELDSYHSSSPDSSFGSISSLSTPISPFRDPHSGENSLAFLNAQSSAEDYALFSSDLTEQGRDFEPEPIIFNQDMQALPSHMITTTNSAGDNIVDFDFFRNFINCPGNTNNGNAEYQVDQLSLLDCGFPQITM